MGRRPATSKSKAQDPTPWIPHRFLHPAPLRPAPRHPFYIISKDKGFLPLTKHLETQNITCHLLPSLLSVPGFLPAARSQAINRIQQAVDGLLTRKEARPRKLKTLTTYINAQLNKEASDAAVDEVISRLKQAGLSIALDGKLTWPST